MNNTKDEELELMQEAFIILGKLIQLHTKSPALQFAPQVSPHEYEPKKTPTEIYYTSRG